MVEPTQRDITDLTKAINSLENSLTKSSRSTRPSGGASSRDTGGGGLDTKSSKNIKKLVDELGDATDLLKYSNKGFFELAGASRDVVKQLKYFETSANQGSDAFKKLAKGSSLHLHALTEADEFHKLNAKESKKMTDAFNNAITSAYINLGNVSDEYKEMLGKGVNGVLDFTNTLDGLVASGLEALEQNELTKEEALALAANFKSMGGNTEGLDRALSMLTGDLSDEMVKTELKKLTEAFRDGAVKTKAAITEEVEARRKSKVITEKLSDEFKNLTGISKFTLGAGLLAAGKAAFEYASAVAKLGSRGGAQLFGDIAKSSVKLGASFETTAETYQQSRRELLILGQGNFDQALMKTRDNLIKFGVAPEEAVKAFPDMQAAFQAMGGQVKDINALNKSIDSQTKQFGELSKITGLTVTEIAKANREFFESSEIQADLLGTQKADRDVRAQGIMQAQKSLTMMGLSLNEANEAIKRAKAIGREDLSTRFKKAARLMQLGAMTGQGSAGMEAAAIVRKGGMATPQETARLTELMAQLNTSTEQSMRGGIASQEVFRQISADVASDLGAAGKLSMAKETGKGVNQEQLDQQKNTASTAAQSLIKLQGILDATKSIPGAVTAAGAMVAIAVSLKGGGLGGLMGGAKGALAGVGGKLAGGIGGKLAGGIGGLGSLKGGLAGVGLLAAQSIVPEDNMAGTILNSNTANYAATGAAIGSFIPGLGTLAGAGIGGAAGLAMDAYGYFSKPKTGVNASLGQQELATSVQEVNKSSISTTTNKTTTDVYDKLHIISTQLDELLNVDKEQLGIMSDHKDATMNILSESEGSKIRSKRIQTTAYNKQELASMPVAA